VGVAGRDGAGVVVAVSGRRVSGAGGDERSGVTGGDALAGGGVVVAGGAGVVRARSVPARGVTGGDEDGEAVEGDATGGTGRRSDDVPAAVVTDRSTGLGADRAIRLGTGSGCAHHT
jgi:hypothetical protein